MRPSQLCRFFLCPVDLRPSGLTNPLSGYADLMQDRDQEEAENEEEHGHLAVPGRESHESEDTLSPDELGTEDEPVPPPSEPKQS